MSHPMPLDQMQFPSAVHQQFPAAGYPMFNPYAAHPYLHPNDMANFTAQSQVTPEMFQMYFQLQMAPQLASGTTPPAGIKTNIPLPPASTLMPSSEEVTDSGNETISPPLSSQQPQQVHSSHTTPHVSPHYPPPLPAQIPHMTPDQKPIQDQQNHQVNQQNIQNNPMLAGQQTPQISPYAINNLLSSTQSFPQEEQDEEDKENPEVRRNTLPTTSSVNRKRRAPPPTQNGPPVIPPNFTANYTPMMMQNFAAFMDPYMRRELCQICGDSASGFHYGVLSCEGCKGFFRRSVNKQSKYICQRGDACTFSYENCTMNRGVRTRCQACRFARCVAMGMNKESVRVSKEEPKKTEEEVSQRPHVISDELRALTAAFSMNMQVSARLGSQNEAFNAVKIFIQSVPNLKSLLSADQETMDASISSFMTGLLTIRAAYTFDPISFSSKKNIKFQSNVDMLRASIRNSVFNDNVMALLTSIHIIQSVNGGSSNNFTQYCKQLRDELAQTHPFEEGIYDRLIMRLGPNINH